MKDYKKELDNLYIEAKAIECAPKSKLEFLGGHLFDFTTYDNSMDALFAELMLEVIDCIVNKTTFEYLSDEARYMNYLTMVNMPFFSGMLDWGSSIRGAWFDEYGHYTEKEEDKFHYITHELSIPKKDINGFMSQLLDWAKEA